MPRYIAKLEGKYFEWSSVVESPVTKAMTLDEFKEYYKIRYGTSSMEDLKNRLSRVEKQGVSCSLGCTLDDFMEISVLNGYWSSKEDLINSLNL